MQKKSFDRDAARRRVILDAARDCILKFGYAKCSLEDIAKQAAVSRPLIYRTLTKGEERFNLSTRRLCLVLKRSRRSSCWLSTGSLGVYQRQKFSAGDLKC